MGKLDLNLLESLHALLQERNVTIAARKLGLSQPTLSAQLKRLREAFADQLLVRADSGRGMMLTPRAMRMIRPLQAAIEHIRLVEDTNRFDPASSQKIFRIAANDYATNLLGLPMIDHLAGADLGLRAAFSLPSHPSTGDALENGEIDLLLDTERNVPSNCKSRVVLRDRFVVGQRKGHPRGKAPLDLDAYCALDHVVVATLRENLRGYMEDQLASLGRHRRVMVTFENFTLVPEMLARNDAITTMPLALLSQHRQELDLFELPIASPAYHISMAWHPRFEADPSATWLRTLIVNTAKRVGHEIDRAGRNIIKPLGHDRPSGP